MDLSVVIVSYNVSSYLDQALITLRDAIAGLDAEVFVVDNNSCDDSVAMVRGRHPWVTLIANADNRGFARANNQALAKAAGKYVLLLNPDTVLRHDTITTMLEFLDGHPEAGAAGCKVLNPDGTLQLACRRGFPTPGVAFFKLVGLSGLFPKSRTFGAYNMTYLDPDQTAEVDALSGSFMMIRREALETVGYLDETFFMYGEDLDLCYRIKQDGWKIYYVHTTEIIHFKGESTRTIPTLKSVRDFYTAMHIFVDKHYRDGSGGFVPGWIMIAGIYIAMAWVSALRSLRKAARPLADLLLLNISLLAGLLLRFGGDLGYAPAYSNLQWVTIIVVYSSLYMLTFFFFGLYHRHKNSPERAVMAIFVGFLFNVFIVNFLRYYNFSRIWSLYCWGFNSLLISGWRFVRQLSMHDDQVTSRSRALVLGSLDDAVALKHIFTASGHAVHEVIGCVESSADAIRGSSRDGVHILGLLDDIAAVVDEYAVQEVIIVGTRVPFTRILGVGGRLGVTRPGFILIPELPPLSGVTPAGTGGLTMIDINPGGLLAPPRSS